MVVVVGVMSVMVMPMMRRVRQGDVCEQNQRGREANNLNHVLVSPTSINQYAPGRVARPRTRIHRIASAAENRAINLHRIRAWPAPELHASFSQQWVIDKAPQGVSYKPITRLGMYRVQD
jgi:DNA-binding transcriptional regulator YdaS (Cro superfamily)